MASKIIGVEGMSCDHCAQTIQKSLVALAGVQKVSVSLEKKEVVVDFDENQVEVTEISSKITEAGYEVLN